MSRLPVERRDRAAVSCLSSRRRSSTRRIAGRAATALAMVCVTFTVAGPASAQSPPATQTGPCDIYAAAGTPCVAAHSSTRALYAAYNGPLYQVKRQSDDAVKDIGVVQS